MVGKNVYIIFVMVLGTLCLVGGCAKKAKKTDLDKGLSTVPVVSEAATVTKSNADTGKNTDIFDEFYKDDKGKIAPAAHPAAAVPLAPKTAKKSPVVQSSPQFSGSGKYVVQISCVGSKQLARKVIQELQNQGYQAYSTEVSNPVSSLNGTYYRIRIGPFETPSAARSFAESNLTPKGYQYWVDRKSNDAMGSRASPESYQTPAAEPASDHSSAALTRETIKAPTPAAVSEPAPPAQTVEPIAPAPTPAASAPMPATSAPALEPVVAPPAAPAAAKTNAASDSVW